MLLFSGSYGQDRYNLNFSRLTQRKVQKLHIPQYNTSHDDYKQKLRPRLPCQLLCSSCRFFRFNCGYFIVSDIKTIFILENLAYLQTVILENLMDPERILRILSCFYRQRFLDFKPRSYDSSGSNSVGPIQSLRICIF